MTEPDVLAAARTEWLQVTKDAGYFSLLPPDAQPQVDMNKATMSKYRPP